MEKDFLPTSDKERTGDISKAVPSWYKSMEALIQRPDIFILEITLGTWYVFLSMFSLRYHIYYWIFSVYGHSYKKEYSEYTVLQGMEHDYLKVME